jgi:hypothetical protein
MGMVVLRKDVDALREELNAVREELDELKEKVDDNAPVQRVPFGMWQHGADAQHQGTKRKAPETNDDSGEDSGKDSEEDESEECDVITPTLPKEKPKPKSIRIDAFGDNQVVPNGKYEPFGDGMHYVPAKALEKSIKLNGFPDPSLLSKPVLAFKNSEAGYQLVVKKSCDSTICAMENANKSWSVHSDEEWELLEKCLLYPT